MSAFCLLFGKSDQLLQVCLRDFENICAFHFVTSFSVKKFFRGCFCNCVKLIINWFNEIGYQQRNWRTTRLSSTLCLYHCRFVFPCNSRFLFEKSTLFELLLQNLQKLITNRTWFQSAINYLCLLQFSWSTKTIWMIILNFSSKNQEQSNLRVATITFLQVSFKLLLSDLRLPQTEHFY